ncbi:hypothetical protein FSP39_011572 [Pinctada imbricata]|uniref:ShKT domain-containing protein n=1 Tax=Pinctada imbricata TaxID=66713 RepID=A0AA89BR11_PINIB|nr:hypothetical protein FSP39_011572 [Pinctada imbricata]
MTMIIIIIISILQYACGSGGFCVIPDSLRAQTWKYRNSRNGHAQSSVSFSVDKVVFKNTVDQSEEIWKCEEMVDVKKFIFSENDESETSYRCVEILERSQSIVQLKSSESSSVLSRSLCGHSSMKIDPWLLVSFDGVKYDFSHCPFSGGFNMKIVNQNGASHGCNYMELPMRFESDCLAGEGITFDFREQECAGFIPMSVFQKTMCISSWHQNYYIFVVIKTIDTQNKLWVLRLPRRLSTKHGHALHMTLFSDLIALDVPEAQHNLDLQIFTLILEKVVQRSLCADEYPNCALRECSAYIKKQCPKSCGVCNPSKPLPVCSYPRRFRGSWYMQDRFGTYNVNISDSMFTVKSVGSFSCIEYEDSPDSKDRMYTTETVFFNGCRPRFTCLSFRRISPSVISYSISQSYRWPFSTSSTGSAICSSDRFSPDNEPIGDRFRNYPGTHKPILPLSNSLKPVNCRLSSTYTFIAVIRGKGKCSGEIYQDCSNSSLVTVDYGNCRAYPFVKTYACAARFKERYWESLTILQNIHDRKDSACLVFSSLKKNKAILLPTSQCDKYSWQFVDNKLRSAEVTFSLTEQSEKCRSITTTTQLPLTTRQHQLVDHQRQADVQIQTPKPERDAKNNEESIVNYGGPDSSDAKNKQRELDNLVTSPRSGSTSLSFTTISIVIYIMICQIAI